MVILTRRELLLGAGATALAAATGGCGASEADVRFRRASEPASATLAGGVQLKAHPARIRIDAEGRPVIRAASPGLSLEMGSATAAVVELVIENVPAGFGLSPPPESTRTLSATAVELRLSVPSGTTRFEAAYPRSESPLRFAVVSDIHRNLDSLSAILADMEARRPAFILCMGDLADLGTEGELDDVFDAIAGTTLPFYSTLGNHDCFGAAVDRFQERFGPTSLAFAFGGAKLVLVDSASSCIAPSSWDWLEAELRAAQGPAFVFTHYPPLDPSGIRDHSFRIRDESLRFIDLLAATRTAGLFVGHIHDQVEYSLSGIPVHLTGGGGKIEEWAIGVGFHYLEIEVRPAEREPAVVTRRDVEVR